MGFACELHRIGAMQYSLDVGNGLVEREYLHLFVGQWNGEPVPAADEVCRVAMVRDIRHRRFARYGT